MEEKMTKIFELISELNPYVDFDKNTNLIEEGIIDSLRLVILVSELQDMFDIKIPEEEIKPENFEKITEILNLIEKVTLK